ncbi:MAG: hypothetical protein JJU28_06380 [Cyclobacteriaceae bacterium]|nr:hypothetical protein [Cyclobacteriaceae bacterium]
MKRRSFVNKILSGCAVVPATPLLLNSCKKSDNTGLSPVHCAYAPCGEYIKDHSIIFQDGWYHLFSISGTEGFYHGYTGNEETISWSISKDLVHWEMRGHILHATQYKGAFDQHQVWAPFCVKAKDGFFMFYTGIIHPNRPMEYRKLGHDHPWVFEGHKETQGLAFSKDLSSWEKISDFNNGLGIPGRDSFVTFDDDTGNWLLYSTIGTMQAHVSVSSDLLHWTPKGICADFPKLTTSESLGATTEEFKKWGFNSAESLTVMKHPANGKWIMLGNWQYLISDNPLQFESRSGGKYDLIFNNKTTDLGFAGEMVLHNGKWYRSGVFGKPDHWKLGFTEIEWSPDGAFTIVKPSILVV